MLASVLYNLQKTYFQVISDGTGPIWASTTNSISLDAWELFLDEDEEDSELEVSEQHDIIIIIIVQ